MESFGSRVRMLPDFDRADRIGEFWGNPKTRTFADLLIDWRKIGRSGLSSSGRCERWSGDARCVTSQRPREAEVDSDVVRE